MNDRHCQLRAHARPALVAFAVVFLALALYSFTRQKVYEAEAAIEVLDYRTFLRMVAEHRSGIIDRRVGSGDIVQMNSMLDYAASEELIARVASRLDSDTVEAIFASYREDPITSANRLQRTLRLNRTVRPYRLNLIVAITYRHPNPAIAARVANQFIDELNRWQNQPFETIYRSSLIRDAAPVAAQTNSSPNHDISNIRPVISANIPGISEYVSPNHFINLGIGLLSGLLAAALTVFLAHRRALHGLKTPNVSDPIAFGL